METPCVNVCVVDPTSRRCVGCCRTIDEIATWASLGAEERRRIMQELPRRRARAGGGG
ncbi:MAG: DUF1289 domain-containing protein [Hyphomicrobiaceae bacterium]|nr:DUF1289 domain-containing protein [Hyphomicrobiaceae bacterium]